MRIDYSMGNYGEIWAIIHNTNGKFTHYYLGTQDLRKRTDKMYKLLSSTTKPTSQYGQYSAMCTYQSSMDGRHIAFTTNEE